MNPLDFLELAKELSHRPTESSRRTAVSRAYYAVFLHCRDRLAVQSVPPQSSRVHQWVTLRLRDEKPRSAALLHLLRSYRNVADYDTAVEFEPAIVAEAPRLTEEVLEEVG